MKKHCIISVFRLYHPFESQLCTYSIFELETINKMKKKNDECCVFFLTVNVNSALDIQAVTTTATAITLTSTTYNMHTIN